MDTIDNHSNGWTGSDRDRYFIKDEFDVAKAHCRNADLRQQQNVKDFFDKIKSLKSLWDPETRHWLGSLPDRMREKIIPLFESDDEDYQLHPCFSWLNTKDTGDSEDEEDCQPLPCYYWMDTDDAEDSEETEEIDQTEDSEKTEKTDKTENSGKTEVINKTEKNEKIEEISQVMKMVEIAKIFDPCFLRLSWVKGDKPSKESLFVGLGRLFVNANVGTDFDGSSYDICCQGGRSRLTRWTGYEVFLSDTLAMWIVFDKYFYPCALPWYPISCRLTNPSEGGLACVVSSLSNLEHATFDSIEKLKKETYESGALRIDAVRKTEVKHRTKAFFRNSSDQNQFKSSSNMLKHSGTSFNGQRESESKPHNMVSVHEFHEPVTIY